MRTLASEVFSTKIQIKVIFKSYLSLSLEHKDSQQQENKKYFFK